MAPFRTPVQHLSHHPISVQCVYFPARSGVRETQFPRVPTDERVESGAGRKICGREGGGGPAIGREAALGER